MYYYDVLHYIDYLEKFDASTITIFQYVIEMVTVQCGMVHGLVGVDRVHKYLVLVCTYTDYPFTFRSAPKIVLQQYDSDMDCPEVP